MAVETVNGVRNFYGPRTAYEGVGGSMATRDAERFAVAMFDGEHYADVELIFPEGAVITGNAVVEINEAFALGGTTPVINVGKVGSEGTDRIAQISEAQAEAEGTYSIAPAGALAINTPLTEQTTVTVALGGGTPTIAGGKCKVIVPFQVL
jgi:hypothetical protein